MKPANGIFKNFFSSKNSEEARTEERLNFEEKRSQLEQRVGVVISGLGRCGIKSEQLNTEQVVEVFYKTFNPEELEKTIQ
jgi:hypothetical protein